MELDVQNQDFQNYKNMSIDNDDSSVCEDGSDNFLNL